MTPEERARQRRQELDDEDGQMVKPKRPFQDFEPPKRIERPGLARPTAVVEHTEFTASNAAARARRAHVAAQDVQRSTSPPEGKRKRNDDEIEMADSEGELPKRRAVAEENAVAPSPKSESLMFVVSTDLTGVRIQKKTLSLERWQIISIRNAIHLQESPNLTNLFRRVKASSTRSNPSNSRIKANVSLHFLSAIAHHVDMIRVGTLNGKGKEKEKEKKNLSRQTTLFGLPAKQSSESEKKSKSKRTATTNGKASADSASASESQMQAKAMDVEMTEAPSVPPQPEDATLVETQTFKQASLVETQPLEEDEEPIEWPESPQASGVELDEQ